VSFVSRPAENSAGLLFSAPRPGAAESARPNACGAGCGEVVPQLHCLSSPLRVLPLVLIRATRR
jgi:hypothetical protein